MTSPLEIRLTSRIAESSDDLQRAIALAELACYYARIGEFERAEDSRTDLRRGYGDGRDLRVSVLIMTLEALLLYFKDLSLAARDRLLRAKLLCSAGGELRLLALTSAWLAHIDFNQDRFDEMTDSIATCLSSLDFDDGTAECRLSLVLGDAYMYCDQERNSKQWYERAHRVAIRLGDQAAIGAMTYNRAALRVSSARLAHLVNPIDATDFTLAKAEVKSAINYQAVAGLRSLDHLLRAAQIGIWMLERDFVRASTELKQILGSGEVPEHSGAFFTLRADQLTCHVRLGNKEAAQACAASLETDRLAFLSADDRAHCLAALEWAAESLGNNDHAISLRQQKDAAIGEDKNIKLKLISSISNFAVRPTVG